MSIEKKSLISNRIASKKAIATKANSTKVASTKTVSSRVAARPKLAGLPNTRLIVHTKVSTN
jgi:hypothetical protein